MKVKPYNVEVVRGDIKKLPFQKNMFDVIYSYKVLMYLSEEDLATVIQQICRVLKKEGIFVCDIGKTQLERLTQGNGVQVRISKQDSATVMIKR